MKILHSSPRPQILFDVEEVQAKAQTLQLEHPRAGQSKHTAFSIIPLNATSHRGSFIMLTLLVHVNDAAVQGPDEGDVQRRVVKGGALHPGVLTHFDVGVGWSQGDLCGFFVGKKEGSEM